MKAVAPDIFKMKQFVIDQAGAAMKVNTDGLCIAVWASMHAHGTVLDIGGGTGLIGLILAQRYPNVHVIGIEPHQPSFECMRKNFELSPWSYRMRAFPQDLKNFTGSVPPGSLNGIVCNPPYFANSSLPATVARLQSRHMHTLKTTDLADCAGRLLASGGLFSVIYPPGQMAFLTSACASYGLHPFRRCVVYSKPGGTQIRVMQTFGHGAPVRLQEESLILYRPDGSYSEAYRDFMKDFLIIF